MDNIKKIAKIFSSIQTDAEALHLLQELFTKAELDTLSKRWQILNMLNKGMKQRDIAKSLQVSLCNVTRGAKILKQKNIAVKKYLDGDKKDDTNNALPTEQRGLFRKFRRAIYK